MDETQQKALAVFRDHTLVHVNFVALEVFPTIIYTDVSHTPIHAREFPESVILAHAEIIKLKELGLVKKSDYGDVDEMGPGSWYEITDKGREALESGDDDE